MIIKMMSALFTIIVLFIADCQSDQCTQHGDVRLVGGSDDYEGNVQVCIDGIWGYVCDNSWSTNDGRVVCKQLGYSDPSITSNSYFGSGNGNVSMDNLYCTSSANKLIECNRGSITCNPYTDIAGVICLNSGACTNGTVRLIQNGYGAQERSGGRVQLCDNNQWVSFCLDDWTDNNTAVVCTQLGYDGSSTAPISYYYGSTPVTYSLFSCTGNETSLTDCPKLSNADNVSFCYYTHAAVRCLSVDESSCVDGEVRLWSAFNNTPSNEGMAQICREGNWYGMCDRYSSSSTCYIGRLICQSLGYSGAQILKTNAGAYYGYYNDNDKTRYRCYSYSTSLDQCYKTNTYWGCGTVSDSLGVVCSHNQSEVFTSECTNGDVRLFNNNSDASNEGRVEYCYNGAWSPMCYLATYTARLICKQLGFDKYEFTVIDNKERFNRSNKRSSFNQLNCNSLYTNLSQCTISKSQGCYETESTCSTEYGLTCIGDTETCTDGDVRLNGGVIEQEGQVEVCFDRIWGAVCDSSWGKIDGYVFCKELGYEGPDPVVYYNAIFGRTNVFPVWNYVRCNGWEKTIYGCSKNIYPTTLSCSGTDAAGVLCKDDCKNGEIRLKGGDNSNEGTVVICRNSLWGQIADSMSWTDANAAVVCRSLGYINGDAIAKHQSLYGKSNLTVHYQTVTCAGHEHDIQECAVVTNSLFNGKRLISQIDVAGVDCVYDEPTPPPCITDPNIGPSDSCSNKGSVRLIKNGAENTIEGRVEYCNGEFWTPLCSMDNKLAAVTCKQLGHSQYSWGTIIEDGTYETLLNYSLVHNITCSSGSESSIIDCTVTDPIDSCLPWCPNGNIGLRCFTNISQCTEGSVRLVDGIIEQEGRIEVCVNGVWGSICDDGWDTTDAHIVCRQMGHPELEPYVYRDSRFDDGQYPIVYSNVSCGGWEDSLIQCTHIEYKDTVCSRQHVAGVLCGYDCKDGDVRLIDGPTNNEGTVEVCYNNIWGLVDENGWGLGDAKVVCSQLGYGIEGDEIIVRAGSYYGKSNKPVYLSNVQCTGNEETLDDCTQTTYSLEEGKTKLSSVNVAGVRCGVSDNCVTPPTGGMDCIDGSVRLVGGEYNNEGILEYCHKGLWSPFCSLNQTEATVACRKLGYTQTKFVSIFDDGRFNMLPLLTAYTSYIENITCTTDKGVDLSLCHIIDGCQVSCKNPIAIKCFESDGCEEGDVRLTDGPNDNEGRIEMCYQGVWGTVCGDGFDFPDGFVACKNDDISEPTIYTNSFYGDGIQPILYSNIQCSGSEDSLNDCDKEKYGDFACSRQNIAGLKCKDDCVDGSVRLVGGNSDTEGTVQVCYKSLWGLVAADGWSNRDASVICHQLGYEREGAVGYTDSRYGRTDATILISNVICAGTEDTIINCYYSPIFVAEENRGLFNISGVSCLRTIPVTSTSPQSNKQIDNNSDNFTTMSIIVAFLVIMLITSVAIIICLVVLLRVKSKSRDISVRSFPSPITMSSVTDETVQKDTITGSVSFDEKIIPL